MQAYATTPEIHTTEAGAEFFLYTLELTDPNTGETKPITFVVIHRVWVGDPVMLASMQLFEAARLGDCHGKRSSLLTTMRCSTQHSQGMAVSRISVK